MTDKYKIHRICVADPYPETIGVTSLTIFVPEDFRGDAEVMWWWPGQQRDEDKQALTCKTTALLQGLMLDVRSVNVTRPSGIAEIDKLAPRIVALVLSEFYRQRIARAAKLEAAYEWQAWGEEKLG